METAQTHEGKASSRNGVKRMIFVIISIVLELLLILMMFSQLYMYAEWISILMRVFALILALVIYSKNITSTMKMP